MPVLTVFASMLAEIEPAFGFLTSNWIVAFNPVKFPCTVPNTPLTLNSTLAFEASMVQLPNSGAISNASETRVILICIIQSIFLRQRNGRPHRNRRPAYYRAPANPPGRRRQRRHTRPARRVPLEPAIAHNTAATTERSRPTTGSHIAA